MDSAMAAAMRTMKVKLILVGGQCAPHIFKRDYMRRRKVLAPPWIKYVEKALALAQDLRWDLFLNCPPHFPNSLLLLIQA